MSIPENIKNLANKVRTAIYGKDVRESIAKSMEETGNIADEAKNTASDAYDITQNLLDESFDTSVINQNFEQRLDNEISNLQPEWTGFKDGVTAQLAQNTNQLADIIFDTTLYVDDNVSTSGNGAENSPLKSINEAIQKISIFAKNTKIIIKQGTYRERVQVAGRFTYKGQWLVLEGEKDTNGIPTTVIDGEGLNVPNGLFVDESKVMVKDIFFKNFTNSGNITTASGLVAEKSKVYTINVHAENCGFAGINANIQSRLLVEGGEIKNCGNGIRAYGGSVSTIGYNGTQTRVKITNCTIGIIHQGSYAHTDYVDFSGCDTGLVSELKAHTTNYNNTFTNCNVGWQMSGDSSISSKDVTLSGVDIPSRSRSGNATQDNEGHRFATQYYEKMGNSGRFAFGYSSWEAPFAKYQYGNGKAGFNLSGFTSTTSLWESDSNTILGLASPDASYTGLWFGDSTQARRGEIRHTGGVFSVLFSGVGAYRIRNTDFVPLVDNTVHLGTITQRWAQLFAGTSTINTSDKNYKQQIGDIPDEVLDAWEKVEYKQFKFNDAVKEKGDNARLHVGVIAQQIKEAFEERGLNALDYGLLCYDEWEDIYGDIEDENGNPTGEKRLIKEKGSIWSVRPDECQFLEMALMRRKIKQIEEKLN